MYQSNEKHNLPPSHYTQEVSVWFSTEGQVGNAGTYFLCLLFFWLLVPLAYALFKIVATLCHTYSLTNQRLRESSGIIFRKTGELELYRVKDISVRQPLLQRLLGCGQVILLTSDRSTPQVVLNAVPAPIAVADLIRHQVECCRVAKGVREID